MAVKETFSALFDSFLADPFFGPASKTGTITIVSGGTVDPITGNVTAGTTTVYTADGFIRDPKEKEFAVIQGGDIVFTVKQVDLGYTPVNQDTIIISGGSTWDGTYKLETLGADGADVTFKLLLRR